MQSVLRMLPFRGCIWPPGYSLGLHLLDEPWNSIFVSLTRWNWGLRCLVSQSFSWHFVLILLTSSLAQLMNQQILQREKQNTFLVLLLCLSLLSGIFDPQVLAWSHAFSWTFKILYIVFLVVLGRCVSALKSSVCIANYLLLRIYLI